MARSENRVRRAQNSGLEIRKFFFFLDGPKTTTPSFSASEELFGNVRAADLRLSCDARPPLQYIKKTGFLGINLER